MVTTIFQTYANSKLANVLFTKTLAQRWAADGIRSFSVHPGLVRTNITSGASSLIQKILLGMSLLMGKDCWQGAQTQIHCCLSDDLINGAYYMDCRPVSIS